MYWNKYEVNVSVFKNWTEIMRACEILQNDKSLKYVNPKLLGALKNF